MFDENKENDEVEKISWGHHEIPQAKKQKTLKQNKQAFARSTKWKCNQKKHIMMTPLCSHIVMFY
jgi:hypothetical protein